MSFLNAHTLTFIIIILFSIICQHNTAHIALFLMNFIDFSSIYSFSVPYKKFNPQTHSYLPSLFYSKICLGKYGRNLSTLRLLYKMVGAGMRWNLFPRLFFAFLAPFKKEKVEVLNALSVRLHIKRAQNNLTACAGRVILIYTNLWKSRA